eukprot:1461270-Pyramimonas_sp.AAC.1
MEGGSFSKCGFRPHAARIRLEESRVSNIEDKSFSKCSSRRSAAHIRFKHSHEFHWLRAVPF